MIHWNPQPLQAPPWEIPNLKDEAPKLQVPWEREAWVRMTWESSGGNEISESGQSFSAYKEE